MGIEEFVLARAQREGLEMGRKEGILRGEKIGEKRGLEKGRFEKNTAFVRNLLQETDFDNQKIARLAGVSLAFVEKTKAAM